MPRRKAKTSTKSKRKQLSSPGLRKNNDPAADVVAAVSIEQILTAAEDASTTEPEHAVVLYTVAIEKMKNGKEGSTRNGLLSALEQRGELYVSMNEPELALQDFQMAKHYTQENDFEDTARLNMYIGQLSQGDQALKMYEQAIHSLEQSLLQQKDSMEVDNEETGIRKQLSAACCSAAELFLTDLCEEPDAESRCEAFVQRAKLYHDPATSRPFVDALQTEASLRLSQVDKRSEAIELALDVYRTMDVGCRALAVLIGLRQDEKQQPSHQARELVEVEAVNQLPGFEFRCQSAKILLESSSLAKEAGRSRESILCNEAAIDVLGSLLSENDEVVEIFHLLGDAFSRSVPPKHDTARSFWERALEMLQAVKSSMNQEVNEAEESEDLQMELDEVICQIEEIESKIEELPDLENE